MNYRPQIELYWQSCPPTAREVCQIERKIDAIVDNVTAIYDYSDPPRTNVINPCQLLKICIDLDDDPTSFELHVCPTTVGHFPYEIPDSKVRYGIYEVLDEEAARFNDADFNAGRPDLGKGFDYVLGEVNSEYTKLGNSEFYFRYL